MGKSYCHEEALDFEAHFQAKKSVVFRSPGRKADISYLDHDIWCGRVYRKCHWTLNKSKS